MPVFGANNIITHVNDSRVVWSSTRRPALLLQQAAVTLHDFDIAYPDFIKNNAYGFAATNDNWGQYSSCASFVTIVPHEWDSGQSFVCTLPEKANYFEVELNMVRIVHPSAYLGLAIPELLAPGNRHMPDGGSAIIEGIGPMVRMFAFERIGSAIYLRRKQSVTLMKGGTPVPWNPGNATHYPNGGMRNGWTHGGAGQGWPAFLIESKANGNFDKTRHGSNACSLADPTNYASLWRGTVTITPGYIAQ